jgi:TrmH family RNA methyltransferase
MIRPVVSMQNENFKIWKQLSTSKGIRKHQSFFLMGEKLVTEFLRRPHFDIIAEVLGPDHRTLLEGRAFDDIPRYQLSREMFDEIDVIGTHFNLLLLKAPDSPREEPREPRGLELILPLGDPSNLGAALRSACAFGIEKVFLCEEACHPFHPKAIKASAGASLYLKLVRTSSLKTILSADMAAGIKNLLVLDQGGTPLPKFSWPENSYLVVGEEGPGLPPHSQPVVSIPTQKVESLNAAVSVSLACFNYQYRSISK